MNSERKPSNQETNPPKMSLSELMERLKPHPILQSILIETMSDKEWEDYALPDSEPSSDH